MKFGTAIIISLLSIISLVAEFILYMTLGISFAISGDLTTLSGFAFFFISLMILTAATGLLAPICALFELIVKKKNIGVTVYYKPINTLLLCFLDMPCNNIRITRIVRTLI